MKPCLDFKTRNIKVIEKNVINNLSHYLQPKIIYIIFFKKPSTMFRPQNQIL